MKKLEEFINEKLKISSKSNMTVDGNIFECTFTDFLDWYFGKDGEPITESDFRMFELLNNKELYKRFRNNYLLLYHFYLDNKYTNIVVYVYHYIHSSYAYRFDVKDVEGFYFECKDDFREYVNKNY